MTLQIGRAKDTNLKLHAAWLPFGAVFVWLLVSWVSVPVAVITVLMWLGTALLHELARVRVAARHHVPFHSVTLFPLGSITERAGVTPPQAAARIAGAGLMTTAVMVAIFAILWRVEPGLIALEMEFIALYNLVLFLYHLLVQMTPRQEHLINAWLAQRLPAPQRVWAWRVPRLMRETVIVTAALATIFVLELGSWAMIAAYVVSLLALLLLADYANRRGAFEVDVARATETAAPLADDPALGNALLRARDETA